MQRMKDQVLSCLLIIIGHSVGQRCFQALTGNGMDKLSGRFIDDEERLVFIANIEGEGERFDG